MQNNVCPLIVCTDMRPALSYSCVLCHPQITHHTEEGLAFIEEVKGKFLSDMQRWVCGQSHIHGPANQFGLKAACQAEEEQGSGGSWGQQSHIRRLS